ncbi:MAG: hypothetical protein FWF05_01655 [Oscillospiraceae bacterium]|nr:hypothetical protein [Oscillospiraceae bacterium]
MGKLKGSRVVEIPPFRAVSSGLLTFDELFGESGFGQWMTARRHFWKDLIYASPDFMWHEDDKSVWIWAVKDGVTEADCAPYEIIEYEGGLFVVATADENDSKDLNKVVKGMVRWIKKSGVFEQDERPGHRGMCHMVGCGAIQNTLGIAQQEIFLPVKFKKK